MTSTLIFAAGTQAPVPDKPVLVQSAAFEFTISNYDSSLTYTVTGGTRTGNKIATGGFYAVVSITARRTKSIGISAAATCENRPAGTYLGAPTIVIPVGYYESVRCGWNPHSGVNCANYGYGPNGDCGPGTYHEGLDQCGGGGGFTLYCQCYNVETYNWTSAGFTQAFGTWGKVT